MCGILGCVNLGFNESLGELIRHRGPDGERLMTFSCGAHSITLAHRRLSIVDLSSAGQQPMRTEDEHGALTYNGEIYNHAGLRKGLPGEVFRGHSDSETLIRHLRRHGIGGVGALRGIFAFAYLDLRAKKLYLVRDRFGVKPLYYRFDEKSLAFGSEIKPLLELQTDQPNVQHLAIALRLRYTPSPLTLFSNIRRLRPGHVLEIDLSTGGLSAREYSFVPDSPPGSTPILRTLSLRLILSQRSVYVEAQALQS